MRPLVKVPGRKRGPYFRKRRAFYPRSRTVGPTEAALVPLRSGGFAASPDTRDSKTVRPTRALRSVAPRVFLTKFSVDWLERCGDSRNMIALMCPTHENYR